MLEVNQLKVAGKEIGKWMPPSVPIGGLLTSGATFFINGGAGVFLSFDGVSDDRAFFNDSLNEGVNMYDGSNLAVKLNCRLSSDGVALDTVGLILSYGIIKDGDNTVTTVTTEAQVDYDVSTEIQDEKFSITLPTMAGVVSADTILITMTRNSSGTGADTYPGDLEVIGLELIIII